MTTKNQATAEFAHDIQTGLARDRKLPYDLLGVSQKRNKDHMTTKNQATAEFAHDIQTGLARHSVPEYEQLPIIGMAASLAMHIRGLGEIDYADRLRSHEAGG
ncbi:hypothetical protein DW076_17455 [Clostridium sp. AF46-12NS]|nr:hypothetical protein DW076_17455 [Clostridium sp. AF46-12NS]